MTWCQDRINDSDVEYIRKELYDELIQVKQEQNPEGRTTKICNGHDKRNH